MSRQYKAAKLAILARSNDPHMVDCEHCRPYVDQLARAEMENRADLALNTLGSAAGLPDDFRLVLPPERPSEP